MRDDCKKTSALVIKARKLSGKTQEEFGKNLKLENPQSKIAQYELGIVCPPGSLVLDVEALVKKLKEKNNKK